MDDFKDDLFTPDEITMIERLQQAPQSTLNSKSVDRLHQRILEYVDQSYMSTPSNHATVSRKYGVSANSRVTLIAACLIVSIVGIPLLLGFVLKNNYLGAVTETPLTVIVGTTNPIDTMQAVTAVVTAPSSQPPIIIEGVVQAISGNIITVNNLNVSVSPDEPMLKLVQVGDTIKVEATQFSSATLKAIHIQNLLDDSTQATTFVEGRVETVNGDSIIINGITIQLPADDPRRKNIRVGTFLSIDGFFQGTGSASVLVIIRLVVVQESDVSEFIQCKSRHAMGMGEPPNAMGMSAPPNAMGMGQPPNAMGMGTNSIDCPT